MVQCIKENGIHQTIRETVGVYKFGQMDQDMMDFGKMAWPVDMAVWSTRRAMFTKEPGTKIKLTVSEFTPTITGVGTRANGSTISNMVKESKSGQMVHNILANTWRE